MKRDYDEVLSEYGIAAYNENASNDKQAITERERLKLISISDAELTLIKQCLSDYLTAAGLIAYGKRDRLMAKRMQGDFIKLRAILDKAENKN